MDQLLEAIEVELDRETRRGLWRRLQEIYVEELPALPLYFRANAHIWPHWLAGVVPTGHQNYSTALGRALAGRGFERARAPLRRRRSMLRHLIHRLLEAALVLVLMSFVIYGLLGLMPGDPIDLLASGDPDVTSADIARLKAVYGLDRPLLERYGHWLASALGGDFGYSRLHAQPVARRAPAAARQHLPADGHQLRARPGCWPCRPASWRRCTRARSSTTALNLLAFAGISVPLVLAGAAVDPAVLGPARLAAGRRRPQHRRRPASPTVWPIWSCRC